MLKKIVLMALLLASFPAFAANEPELSVLPGDHVLGSETAPVTLIEYASLSCPHCANFYVHIVPVIKKEYVETGKVKFIFRDFPLNMPAMSGSKLVSCAGEQGGKDAYFAALERLFENQNDWAFGEDFDVKGTALLANSGLDKEKLDACFKNPDTQAAIMKTAVGAQKLGVNSTPYLFMNGEKVEFLSLDDMRKKFDEAVAAKK